MESQTKTHQQKAYSLENPKIDFVKDLLVSFRQIKSYIAFFSNHMVPYVEYLREKIKREGLFCQCKGEQTNLFRLWEDIQVFFALSDVGLLPFNQRFQLENLSLSIFEHSIEGLHEFVGNQMKFEPYIIPFHA